MKQKFVIHIEASYCVRRYESMAEEKAVFLVLSTLDRLRRGVVLGK